MLSIGNRKHRNLQEQVGFNTEQIEKIFAVLDGLNVQDNVVTISDLSTPLTAEELKIVSREVAFIVYSGELYIKKSEDASNAYFDIVFTISVSGDVVSFSSKEITVTLSNGALGLASSSSSTYSTTHIDSAIGAKADTTYVNSQLALKANLSGADFTGPVTAPTLLQTQANFSQTFNFATSSGLTITNIYNRCCAINNIMYLIANIKVKNTSGAVRKIGGAWGDPAYIAFSLPSSIAEKIFDIDNVSANSIGTDGKLITSVPVVCASGTVSAGTLATYNSLRFDFTNRALENGVACYFRSNEIIDLAIDEEVTLMARVALTLI